MIDIAKVIPNEFKSEITQAGKEFTPDQMKEISKITDGIGANKAKKTKALAKSMKEIKSKGLDVQQVTQSKSNSKQTKQSAADMISTKTTSVEPNQQRVWSEREITAMSVAEFDKYESEISNAMQEGRIIK